MTASTTKEHMNAIGHAELQNAVARAMEAIETELSNLATLGSQVEPRRGFEIVLRFETDGRRSCQIRPVGRGGAGVSANRGFRR